MRASRDAGAPSASRANPLLRLRRELRAAVELWLLPALVVLPPYRAGILLARAFARWLPIYASPAQGAARYHAAILGGADTRAWRNEYRFQQLVDHADLFWALTRPRAFLDRRLPARPLPARGAPAPGIGPPAPLLVLSFHFGQGLWLLHWLAAGGAPVRFVSIRLARELSDSSLAYAYARLRVRAVEVLAGAPVIFTGGARREIADSLAAGATVYGLVDVPLADAAGLDGNATLFGHRVVLPSGLVESAIPGTCALLLSSWVGADGSREVEQEKVPVASLSMQRLADVLAERVGRASAAWHFWHLWPRFLARTGRETPRQGEAERTAS